MVTMLMCVGRMERRIPLSVTYTKLAFNWPTLERVDLNSVVVKSVEMMDSPTSPRAMPEHMASALTTQESALLKSKPLLIKQPLHQQMS